MSVQPLPAEKQISSFEHLLIVNNIRYIKDGNYLLSGKIPDSCDWIICISVISQQVSELLTSLIPKLKNQLVTFKIPASEDDTREIIKGNAEGKLFGRMVVVYPDNHIDFNILVNSIRAITIQFKGPAIPDLFPLADNIYIEYNGLRKFRRKLWPFDVPIPKLHKIMKRVMFGKYIVTDELKSDFKGKVFYGWYLSDKFSVSRCVIKEGRQYMSFDAYGRDVRDRLRWQCQLQQDLSKIVNVPRVIDLIDYRNNSYLVMEYIYGPSLQDAIKNIYKKDGIRWADLTPNEQAKLIDYTLEAIRVVNILHKNGYVHRDVKPENFLLNKDGKIVLIDLELTYSLKLNYPLPAFAKGTRGFMSPQQMNVEQPTIEEDIYAIGGFILYVFSLIGPHLYSITNLVELEQQISSVISHENIIQLILRCYQPKPENRPSIEEILFELQSFKSSIS